MTITGRIQKELIENLNASIFDFVGSSVEMEQKAKNMDQMEKEIIAYIQKIFSDWRAQQVLEIGIAGPLEIEDIEDGEQMGPKQNGEQFGMKQSQQYPPQQQYPRQQQQYPQQQL